MEKATTLEIEERIPKLAPLEYMYILIRAPTPMQCTLDAAECITYLSTYKLDHKRRVCKLLYQPTRYVPTLCGQNEEGRVPLFYFVKKEVFLWRSYSPSLPEQNTRTDEAARRLIL